MRAALATAIPTTSLSVRDVDEPPCPSNELLVAVDACGICGTDLHILAGESYRPGLPFVLGHEPVGHVIAAQSAELEPWVGRRVTMTLFEGCGACAHCRAGDERLCPYLRSILGVHDRWGGFAERLCVPVAQAVEVPDGLGLAEAASLVDAGATAANAAAYVGTLASRAVAIVGGGPVGFLTAELLRLDGGNVVVVEPSEKRRSLLDAAGHETAASTDELGVMVDVVVDCAGSVHVPPWALDVLAPRGTLVTVGYTVVREFDLAPIARKELIVRGIRSGNRRDLQRVLGLAADGSLSTPPIDHWPLELIDDAFAALRAGDVAGKAVIVLAPD